MNKNPCALQDGILFGLPTNNAPTVVNFFISPTSISYV